MKPIFRSKKAIEDMPLRLLIIVIILGITLPIIYELFTYYDQASTVNNAKQVASDIVAYVQEVFSSSVNSSMNFNVIFKDGFFTKIQSVIIGDSLNGPLRSVIKINFYNMNPYYVVIQDPNVIVSSYCASSKTWESLTLGANVLYTLHIVTDSLPSSYGYGTFVQISVISPPQSGC